MSAETTHQPSPTGTAGPILVADSISAGYGQIPVLRDVSLEVRPGEIVSLLGPNGAGKTTTLLALAGEVSCSSGTVLLGGSPAPSSLHRRARKGLAYVPDTRGVFARLSVRDNLRLARIKPDAVLESAPELATRGGTRAGLLSGGEQQILAVSRALARRPQVLLIDELSLGLAPKVVDRLVGLLRRAADEGVGVLMVEQHTAVALSASDRIYVLSRGEVALAASAAELRERPEVLEQLYLARNTDEQVEPTSPSAPGSTTQQ